MNGGGDVAAETVVGMFDRGMRDGWMGAHS